MNLGNVVDDVTGHLRLLLKLSVAIRHQGEKPFHKP
jgi:hypothetical protein